MMDKLDYVEKIKQLLRGRTNKELEEIYKHVQNEISARNSCKIKNLQLNIGKIYGPQTYVDSNSLKKDYFYIHIEDVLEAFKFGPSEILGYCYKAHSSTTISTTVFQEEPVKAIEVARPHTKPEDKIWVELCFIDKTKLMVL